MKVDLQKILDECAKNSPLMFHPVHERSDNAWFPSNDAAQILMTISNAWEDILCISKIRNNAKTDYEKKLLFKYTLIELRSIIQQIEKLNAIIFRIIANKGNDSELHGYISEEEEKILKTHFKNYHTSKNKVDKDIIEIRKKIGAHRDPEEYWNICNLWDKLEPELFRPILLEIPLLFENIRKLDIYDWTKIPEAGTIEINCSGLTKDSYKF